MFWGFKLKSEIEKRFADTIKAGKPLLIRDEWSASGPAHVGSLRGIVIHGVIADVLHDASIKNAYRFEINDFEAMDGLPKSLDQEKYSPFMGRLLCEVPSPDGKAQNFAEYWATQFKAVVEKTGYSPEFYRSSELYRAGKYNEVIQQALNHAARIRAIYKKVAGSEKGDDWFPIQVVCESCGKVGTTRATSWDGSNVHYACVKDQVDWAVGCGHEGDVDPFDGRAKLPWKVEWPAKFKVLGVNIEGAGKDHNTKGGSRDIARHILREVFQYPEPVNIAYDFFTIEGKKMASSKGLGATAQDVVELLPTPLLRFLNMKEPKQPIEFDPHGDTVPILYDMYDKYAQAFFGNVETDMKQIFPFLHASKERSRLSSHLLPRFSQIAYLAQMPHINLEEKVGGMKGSELTKADKVELHERADYARHWLKEYSPAKYQFDVQEHVPEAARSLSPEQKQALNAIYTFMQTHPKIQGEELHSHIHEIKKNMDITPSELFTGIYRSILGKDSGPQAGWFLSALDRDFVLKRLAEVSS